MKTEILGEGEPDYAVVTCIHGEESCGWEAVQKFKESGHELKKPLKVILANEKAFEFGERYVDVDMNRVFPGDPDSEKYEERMAYKLERGLEGLKVLDIHSTVSREAPFGIIVGDSGEEIDLAKSAGIQQLVDMSYVGGMSPEICSVTVELSRTSGNPAEDAYDLLVNFLAAEGLIDAEFERSNPEFFKVYSKEEGSGYEFLASNFQKVEEGEVYAEKDNGQKIAEQGFYPVLMSTDGYDDMIGFKAEKRDI
ncbi:succinylglutamate desuccinylase [Nanohaloarchaea archaeon H01]|nr:succinylglutamate desuccinylase [Nanohaloarchaea archaeon H01]